MSSDDMKLAIKLTATDDGLHGQLVVTEKDLDRLSDKAKKASRESKKLASSMKTLGRAVTAAAFYMLGQNVFRAAEEMRALNNTFKVATGSIIGAGREMSFVRQEALRLGLDLRSTAKDYAALSAAAKGTELAGQKSRDIFIGVSEAMTALGRNSEATSGALKAIEQMISKGNVQAEELRGQLGERLPGAFQLAAKAMGVTTQELNKMLDNGEVLATDLLPKLAAELHKTFGEGALDAASSPTAAWNRFKTALFERAADVGSSGFNEVFGSIFDGMADVLSSSALKDAARGLGEFWLAERDFIVSTFDVLSEKTEGWGTYLQDVSVAAFSAVTESAKLAFDYLAEFLKGFGNGVVATLNSSVDVTAIAVETFVTLWLKAFKEVSTRLSSFGEAWMAFGRGEWGKIGNLLGTAFSDEFDLGVGDPLGRMQDAIKKNANTDWMAAMAPEASKVGDAFMKPFVDIAGEIGARMGAEKARRAQAEWEKTELAIWQENEARNGNILAKQSGALSKSAQAWNKQAKAIKEQNEEVRWAIQYGEDTAEYLTAERDLREKVGDLTEEQRAKLKDLYAEAADLKKVKEATDEWQGLWEGAADSFADDWMDGFRDMLEYGRFSFDKLGESLIGSMRDAVSEVARMLVFKPMMNGLVGGLGGGFGFASPALAGNGSAVSSFSAGLGSFLPGVASLGAGAGASGLGLMGLGSAAFGAYNAFQSGASFVPAMLSGNAGLATSAFDMTGSLALNDAILNATSLAGALGSFAGSWGADALFGNNRGIGADIGGMLGGIAGSFIPIPFVGTALGSFIGSSIGGLFGGGGSRPVAPHGSTSISYNANKGWYDMTDTAVNSGNTFDPANAYLKVLKETLKQTGAALPDSGKIGVGYIQRGGDDGFHDQAGFEAIVEREIFKVFTSGNLDVPAALAAALEGATSSDALEVIASFSEARSAIIGTLETMTEAAPELTSMESAFQSLLDQFDDLTLQADEYGIALSKVEAAEAAQLAKFRETYNDGIAQQILEKTDPYQAALNAFDEWAEELRREAETVGGDMLLIEELIGLERIDLLEQYGEDVIATERRISAARKAALDDELVAFLDELNGTTTYGTGAMDALTYTQDQFDTLRGEALTGNVSAIEQLDDVGKRLIDLYEQVYAHNPDFYVGRDFVESTIENVRATLPGFWTGGDHTGGLRIVGEHGPELELTGASRIFNADQTRQILSPTDSGALEGQLERLIGVMEAYRGQDAKQTEALWQAIEGLRTELEAIRRRQSQEAA